MRGFCGYRRGHASNDCPIHARIRGFIFMALLTLNVMYAKLPCTIVEQNDKTALVRIKRGDSHYPTGTVVRANIKDIEEKVK